MEQDNYLEIPVEYSTDGTVWSSFGTTGETPLTRTLQPDEKVYLRATTDAWYKFSEGTEEHVWQDAFEHSCAIFGVSKVGGNVMSLLYGSSFTGDETTFPSDSTKNFKSLFDNSDKLINASELLLPATTLAPYCYSSMFSGCSALTAAPVLPATTLANGCYNDMFNGCTSLTTAPELPATTLAYGCYQNMFRNCTSLTTASELPVTTLVIQCYCGMFSGCTSLTTAPELPATTLVNNCYQSMFKGCTSLTTAPALSATTLAFYCYNDMFNGCTSLTTAPELPATTLVNNCYRDMLTGCTNLNYVKCLATTNIQGNCNSWLSGVSATGTFVKAAGVTWPTGSSGIPSGWTVEDATV